MKTSIYESLKEKGIHLPEALTPVGLYVPVQRVGNLVYVSGQGCIENGVHLIGRIGQDISVEEGARRAKICMLNTLSALQTYLGSLDNVVRPIKLLGFVNCTDDFTGQAAIINSASQLLLDAFGEENGRHARSAIGSNSLPLGLTVEIESIFEVK